MLIWFALPIALLALLVAAFARTDREYVGDPQRYGRALVRASLVASLWTWAGTELLSAFCALTPSVVRLWWFAGFACASMALAWAYHQRRPAVDPLLDVGAARSGVSKPRTPTHERLFAGLAWLIVAAVLVTTFWGGIAAPPNNADSLDYHLPRQHSWAQNASVAFFDVVDTRMLAMPPFTEYASLHLRLLTGTDRLSFVPSWVGMLVAIVAAALATRELGGDRVRAAFAALLAATIPIAIMLAETPKNDCVVAAGVGVLVWLGAKAWGDGSLPWSRALEFGSVLGLLVLTKGTGLIYGGLLGASLALAVVCAARRATIVGTAVRLVVVGLLVLAVNAPHWTRNTLAFGGPLSSGEAKGDWGLSNTLHTPAAVTSNVIRNAMLHLPLPWAPWNRALASVDETLHEQLGIAINDARTTFAACPTGPRHQWDGVNEGSAGAPVHAIAILLAVGVLWRFPWRVTMSFVVACSLLLGLAVVLKWQYWHSRFHIAILVAWVPSLAIVFGGSLPRLAIAVAATGFGAWSLLFNSSRPILDERPFYERPSLELMIESGSLIEDTRRVGLLVDSLRPTVVGAFTGIDAPLYAVMRELQAISCRPLVVNYRWDGKLKGVIRPPLPDVVVLPQSASPAFRDIPCNVRFVTREVIGAYRVYVREHQAASSSPQPKTPPTGP